MMDDIEFLQYHIYSLLYEYDLFVNKWLKRPCWNSTTLDGSDLRIAYIVDEECYVSALHEIGHIVLNTTDEVAAWKWARSEAIHWSDEMDDLMFRCLDAYGLMVN